MRVRASQSKAGQDPQRSHRGNCKKRILHAWYTTYSLGNAGYRLGYRCAPARTQRLSLCTVKRNSRGSENRILTDVLEQQGAGPVIREQITSRHVAAVLRGVIAGASMEPTGIKAMLANR